MTRPTAPANLPQLVKSAFAKALSTSELHYFPTQVTILPVNSIPFQLRFSPALANKPKGPPPSDASPSRKPFDPFASPPPSLFIADLGPAHFLVLNKFAVVPQHFILATKEYKPQAHVLEEPDLEATLACIGSYEQARSAVSAEGQPAGDGLFAFFNCGDRSGASQPHRHIQLLPVSQMKEGLGPRAPWDVLAGRLGALQLAPFATFAEPITTAMPAADLHAAYLRLYRRACRAVVQRTGRGPAEEDIPAAGEAKISYNMAMTRDTLVVCPRLAEGADIMGLDGAEAVGSLALNGTLLAGTALVKSEAEWTALKDDPERLLNVLRAVGVPRDGHCEGSNKL